MEYYDSGGGDEVSMSWRGPWISKQIIPTSQLFLPGSGGGDAGSGGAAGTGGSTGAGGSAVDAAPTNDGGNDAVINDGGATGGAGGRGPKAPGPPPAGPPHRPRGTPGPHAGR